MNKLIMNLGYWKDKNLIKKETLLNNKTFNLINSSINIHKPSDECFVFSCLFLSAIVFYILFFIGDVLARLGLKSSRFSNSTEFGCSKFN